MCRTLCKKTSKDVTCQHPPETGIDGVGNKKVTTMRVLRYQRLDWKTGTWFVPKASVLIFLFKCLLDSPEITSYLLQIMTLGKLHSGSNVFSTDHSSTGSHFP